MRRRAHRWVFALACGLALSAGVRDGFDIWVTTTELPPVLVESSVEMRDAKGRLLRAFPVENGRMRLAVQLDQVDPTFVNMLIAYEDKRFWTHQGVDPLALVRASWQALWRGRVVSGGSTLSMQVARLLENSGTGALPGKLRQMRVALALERRFSKDEILQLYLMHAPYGGALEGVRAASLAWFGKEPRRLTPAQSALLVALPQSPERRRPDRHAEAATHARNLVLARVEATETDRLSPVPSQMRPFPRLAPHLADHIRGNNPELGRHDLTLDASLQSQMEALAGKAVLGQPRGVSAAIVVADHQNGALRAVVGSPAYAAQGGMPGFVDMSRAVRSPGSTLKPFIYALAFDQGFAHPETMIVDAPVSIERYAPQNFDGQYRGALSLRAALQQSLNIPPVLLTQKVGAPRLMATLRQAGLNPKVPGGKPGLAVILGGVGVTLLDLVEAYAGLANGGIARPLTWEAGELTGGQSPFVSPAAAWYIGDILSGIAPPAGAGAYSGRIAFKTGTSYGHRDAWAVGYDGRYVVGVWLGRPDGTPVPGAFGGGLAAPILFEAFGRIAAKHTPLPAPPDTALLARSADLPGPMRRFQTRAAILTPRSNQPKVLFPPDGANLIFDGGVPLKLEAGVLPLTVLVNGAPAIAELRGRETMLEMHEPGFFTISVIDATGQGAQVNVKLQH